ncbi:MAG: peptide chain release factor aRF-1 [Candidatus Micrarchaeia archaeon]
MESESKLRYDLKKKLSELSKIRGSGTELISVYMPPSSQIADISNKLKEEYGQASNIKSKTTRKNVQDALEKIIQYLKIFRKPPETGLAIFCGNISQVQGKEDIRLFSIVPPEPINVQVYRCDSTFFLDPLEEMLAPKETYGLVLVDGKDATVALLKGKNVRVVKQLHSTAHSKIVKGGQSARRFQRIIEESIEKYYKRIGEAMDSAFLPVKDMKGVIVGGPGPAKENFLKLKPFNYQINVIGVVDVGYTDEYGIRELLEKAQDIIAEQEIIKERKLVDRFMREVVKGGLATYGFKEVLNALRAGQVETLLVSEELDKKLVVMRCSACGKTVERITSEPKEEECDCGGRYRIESEIDVGDLLIEEAEKAGVNIETISSGTSEGGEFLMGFHGIGALLRYK